jgi:hypothetical protein
MLTHSTEQSPSQQANGRSASHDISVFIEPKDSLPYSNEPAKSEALYNIS